MAIKAIIFDCFGVLVVDSINAFYDKYVPNNPALVEELKALDHLSTEGKITFDELLTKEQQALFDDFVLSFEHGIPKPDPRIFQLAAR